VAKISDQVNMSGICRQALAALRREPFEQGSSVVSDDCCIICQDEYLDGQVWGSLNPKP
jgi:hypothetical protein